jgi:hypothetical protein
MASRPPTPTTAPVLRDRRAAQQPPELHCHLSVPQAPALADAQTRRSAAATRLRRTRGPRLGGRPARSGNLAGHQHAPALIVMSAQHLTPNAGHVRLVSLSHPDSFLLSPPTAPTCGPWAFCKWHSGRWSRRRNHPRIATSYRVSEPQVSWSRTRSPLSSWPGSVRWPAVMPWSRPRGPAADRELRSPGALRADAEAAVLGRGWPPWPAGNARCSRLSPTAGPTARSQTGCS